MELPLIQTMSERMIDISLPGRAKAFVKMGHSHGKGLFTACMWSQVHTVKFTQSWALVQIIVEYQCND